MAEVRESTFLPTIKCSSCGLQVEISLMGDHSCPGPSVELSPPPDSNDKFDDPPFNQSLSEKYGRLPTPVDTGAANRAFINQGQLTPVSHSGGSSSVSPITPDRPTLNGHSDEYFALETGKGDTFPRTPEYGTAPLSSRAIGDALLERMNKIAPGPFDANRRPSASKNAFPARKESLTKWDGPLLEEPTQVYDRPGTSHSNRSAGSNGIMATPKQPKKEGYEGFGPPASSGRELEPSALGTMSRSETYPKPSAAVEPSRRPSYPNPPPSARGPDTSRRPPPRTSLIPQDLPTHSIDLAAEFGVSNPYHTPSDSASSGYSTFSGQSQVTSQTSPARSEGRGQGSNASNANNVMDSLKISTEKLRPPELHIDPTVHVPLPARSPMLELSFSERYDPAIQQNIGQESSYKPYRPYVPPTSSSPSLQLEQKIDSKNEGSPKRMGTPPRGAPPSQKAPRDPTSQASRGDCKACGQPITGKSVSSADGRLTGKYHKACFVCTTCSGPFTSAEFYVLDDKPYCEQHYHKLNGTLCGGCGRGIEGQYVEDEFQVKHHVECFCCADCGRSLSSGYFEVDGKAYCEQDALRRTQQSPVGAGEPGPYPQGPRRGGFGGPGPRPFGGPPGRPGGPSGPGPRPGYGLPGTPRGGYGGPPPGRPGPGMGPKPQMNKRMTRLGMM